MSEDERRQIARAVAAAYLVCNKDAFECSDKAVVLQKFQSAFDDFMDLLDKKQGVK